MFITLFSTHIGLFVLFYFHAKRKPLLYHNERNVAITECKLVNRFGDETKPKDQKTKNQKPKELPATHNKNAFKAK